MEMATTQNVCALLCMPTGDETDEFDAMAASEAGVLPTQSSVLFERIVKSIKKRRDAAWLQFEPLHRGATYDLKTKRHFVTFLQEAHARIAQLSTRAATGLAGCGAEGSERPLQALATQVLEFFREINPEASATLQQLLDTVRDIEASVTEERNALDAIAASLEPLLDVSFYKPDAELDEVLTGIYDKAKSIAADKGLPDEDAAARMQAQLLSLTEVRRQMHPLTQNLRPAARAVLNAAQHLASPARDGEVATALSPAQVVGRRGAHLDALLLQLAAAVDALNAGVDATMRTVVAPTSTATQVPGGQEQEHEPVVAAEAEVEEEEEEEEEEEDDEFVSCNVEEEDERFHSARSVLATDFNDFSDRPVETLAASLHQVQEELAQERELRRTAEAQRQAGNVRIQELEASAAALTLSCQAQATGLTESKSSLSALQERYQTVQAELTETRAALEAVTRSAASEVQVEAQQQTAAADVGAATATATHTASEPAEAKEASAALIQALREQLAATAADVARAVSERDAAAAQRGETASRLSAAEASLQTVQGRVAALEHDLEAARAALTRATAETDTAAALRTQQDAELAKLRAELQAAKAQVATHTTEMEALRKSLVTAAAEAADGQAAHTQTLTAALQERETQLMLLREEAGRLEEDLDVARRQLHLAEEQLRFEAQRCTEAEDEIRTERARVEAALQDHAVSQTTTQVERMVALEAEVQDLRGLVAHREAQLTELQRAAQPGDAGAFSVLPAGRKGEG